MEFEIREYREENLPALAEHCERGVKAWPSGFTMGGDFSPEGIREWLLKSSYLNVWLAWSGDDVVGVLKYCRYFNDPECTYVDFLQVQPDFHGKGVGKALLITCVDKAIDECVKRLDLNTWAANTKAVPLYKRTGFFWRPRQSWVHMYNFLPLVLSNPLVEDFVGDSHWYSVLQQPAEIKEDADLVYGCHYHRYIFEKDDRRMEVAVDPSTAGIAGISSDWISIRVEVPGITHVAGLKHPVRWVLESNAGKPLEIKIKCDSGRPVRYKFKEKFELEGEETFDSVAEVDASGRPESINWYGKPLTCKIEIDDREMEFRPGLRVVPPFEVTTSPEPVRLKPGEIRNFIVNLRSRIPYHADFTPELKVKGSIENAVLKSRETLTVKNEDTVGIPVAITADSRPGKGTIELRGTLKVGASVTEIHPVRLDAAVSALGVPVEVPHESKRFTTVGNGIISVKAERKGGAVSITDFESGQTILGFDAEEIGEPYSREFFGSDYDINVETSPNAADIIMKIASVDFPGIILERILTIGIGKEIELRIRITNEGDRAFNGKVMIKPRSQATEMLTMPVKDGIYYGMKEQWIEHTFPLPAETEKYPEKWMVLERPGSWRTNRIITGILFENADGLNWGQWLPVFLEQKIENLAPGETVTLKPTRFILDAPDWQYVQRKALGDRPSLLPSRKRYFIHAESPIFADDGKAVVKFNSMTKNKAEVSARVVTPDGNSVEGTSKEINCDKSLEIEVPEITDSSGNLIALDYSFKSDSIERAGILPVFIPAANASIKIRKDRKGDYDFFEVDNGCIIYSVAPEFGGSMVRLSEKSAPEKNLLNSPFPTPSMWTWFNPWYGGVTPSMWLDYQFYQSGFVGDTVSIEWGGWTWEGIRVTITPVRKWRSMRIESLYLTRPGYPAVLNLLRFSETEGCSRQAEFNVISWPCPSGDPARPVEAVSQEAGLPIKIYRSERGTDAGGGRWVALRDPESSKTVGIVMNTGCVYIWDTGESGQAIWASSHIKTMPGITTEFALMYVVTDNADHVGLLHDSFSYLGSVVSKQDPVPLDL